jgi:hypothetical protein
MKRLWATLALLFGAARPALACDDIVSEQRIVGVAPDGSFVLATLWAGGVSCTLRAFELRGPDGRVRGRYVDDPDLENDCATRVRIEGKVPLPVAGSESLEQLERRLSRELELRLPGQASRTYSVHQRFSGGPCLQVWAVEKQGYIPIWRQDTTLGLDCVPVIVSARQSPRSSLLFLTYKYERLGECSRRMSGTHWLRAEELEAARLVHRGEQLFSARNFAASARRAEVALTLAPTLVPARVLLARSLVRQGMGWPEAAPRLRGSYPPGEECREGTFLDWYTVLTEHEAWTTADGFQAWLDAETERHDAAHDRESDFSGWDR